MTERSLSVFITKVHHIKPLAQGGTNDDNNLRALCTSCHSEITAREGGRWG
ncbi:MAG: HNH endonuclease [Syntrophomonadaceae bacterium]|nr:HNH endonuclease [Syntrophomonadaceae bacterium]